MFVGLLVLTILSRKSLRRDIAVGLAAAVIAVGVSLIASPSVGVIAATLAASTFGMVVERWK
ncbi:hypothetical protein D3C73_1578720 [compost metagenome]